MRATEPGKPPRPGSPPSRPAGPTAVMRRLAAELDRLLGLLAVARAARLRQLIAAQSSRPGRAAGEPPAPGPRSRPGPDRCSRSPGAADADPEGSARGGPLASPGPPTPRRESADGDGAD